jgi:CHAT domain-containing protein
MTEAEWRTSDDLDFLLGQRSALSQPPGRAGSLQEAMDWRRKLSAREAAAAIELLPRHAAGVETWGGRWTVPFQIGPLSRGRRVAAPKREAQPYAHPYYWAAFTLVGDPD